MDLAYLILLFIIITSLECCGPPRLALGGSRVGQGGQEAGGVRCCFFNLLLMRLLAAQRNWAGLCTYIDESRVRSPRMYFIGWPNGGVAT